jgi:hypothetical protein
LDPSKIQPKPEKGLKTSYLDMITALTCRPGRVRHSGVSWDGHDNNRGRNPLLHSVPECKGVIRRVAARRSDPLAFVRMQGGMCKAVMLCVGCAADYVSESL